MGETVTRRGKGLTIAGLVGLCIGLLTLIGLVGKPWASYGAGTNRLAVCERAIDRNTNEIRRVEKEARDCRDALARDIVEMKQTQASMAASLELVQAAQTETRSDIKELLRRVR